MDLGRSIDYLETRPDIDTRKLGFYGISSGALTVSDCLPSTVDSRPRCFHPVGYSDQPAEIDSWNFAPRFHVPVLMVNGRNDFIFPLDTNQKLLFEALGTKEPDKKHILYDGGHRNLVTRPDLLGEVLDWFDRYLGPVESVPSSREAQHQQCAHGRDNSDCTWAIEQPALRLFTVIGTCCSRSPLPRRGWSRSWASRSRRCQCNARRSDHGARAADRRRRRAVERHADSPGAASVTSATRRRSLCLRPRLSSRREHARHRLPAGETLGGAISRAARSAARSRRG